VDYGVETIKMADYGYMAAGLSPCVRALAAASAVHQPCLWRLCRQDGIYGLQYCIRELCLTFTYICMRVVCM